MFYCQVMYSNDFRARVECQSGEVDVEIRVYGCEGRAV